MINEREWNVLIGSIVRGDCIALIGAGLSTTAEDGERRNLTQSLSNRLTEYLRKDKISVQDPDNFPLVAQLFMDQDDHTRDDLVYEVDTFYQGVNSRLATGRGQDTVFENLAALPFPLFISSRHDSTLEHFLSAGGRNPDVKSYDFRGDKVNTVGESGALGTRAKPLVYHLLGSIGNPSSLALTESDLLVLLESLIAGDPPLPTDLRSAFSEKSFLFLGCRLQKYYIRVLLHALGLNDSEKKSFAPSASAVCEVDDEFRESVWFYKVGYKALKLLEIDEENFIQELRRRWEESGGAYEPRPSATETVDESPERPKVFVSYVSEDLHIAKQLVEALKGNGIEPWFDKDELRGGDRWDEALADAIKEVDFFIVLLSNHFGDGIESYVHDEVEKALERKRGAVKFVFPMRITEDALRLDVLDRKRIQAERLNNLDTDVTALAGDIRKEFKKLRRR